MEVQPHVKRMVEEMGELTERTEKLGAFIEGNDLFETLPVDEQERMRKQLLLMQMYQRVLDERISHVRRDNMSQATSGEGGHG